MGITPFEEAIFTTQRTYVENRDDIYVDGVVLLNVDHILTDIVVIKDAIKNTSKEDILFTLNTMLSGVSEEVFREVIEERLFINNKIDKKDIELLIEPILHIKEDLENIVSELKTKYQFYISIDEDRIFILNKHFSFIESIYQLGEKDKAGYILNIILCSRR